MSNDQATDFANEVGKLRVLMEQVLHEVQATNEGVGAMQQMVARKPDREEFDSFRRDIQTIKVAVTATNRDVAGHESRISRLEAA